MLYRKAFLIMASGPIPHIEPVFHDEAERLFEYASSGAWLTEHKKTRELENELANILGVRFCYMYPNCTLALYAAIIATDVVGNFIVPDFTMIATPNSIIMAGCEPVFVDVKPDTLCIDIDAVESVHDAVGVIAVDLNGRSPNYERLVQLCKRRKWVLIEDAAQALGSSRNLKPLGTFGDIGCFSFSPHKIITMGQGGCCVTNDVSLANNLSRFRDFGRAESGGYVYETFGINLKFSDLQAVVGLTQLETLEQRKQKKREIYARYRNSLECMVEFLPTDLVDVSPWYVDVFTDRRDELAKYLAQKGIGTQMFYPAVHNTIYPWGDFPISERVSSHGLWLPSSVNLTNEQIDYVCDVIWNFFRKG